MDKIWSSQKRVQVEHGKTGLRRERDSREKKSRVKESRRERETVGGKEKWGGVGGDISG